MGAESYPEQINSLSGVLVLLPLMLTVALLIKLGTNRPPSSNALLHVGLHFGVHQLHFGLRLELRGTVALSRAPCRTDLTPSAANAPLFAEIRAAEDWLAAQPSHAPRQRRGGVER